jgi:ATP-dependent Clp protease ATP-binding subunit ClpA
VKFVDELKTSLTAKNIRLNLAEDVIDMLATKGYDSKMGARPLSRKIDELIRVPLSKKILFENLTNCTVYATMNNDKIDLRTESEPSVVPTVNADGIIVVENTNEI